jgi:hypothetical protein
MIRRSSTPDVLQTSLRKYQFKSALSRKSAPLAFTSFRRPCVSLIETQQNLMKWHVKKFSKIETITCDINFFCCSYIYAKVCSSAVVTERLYIVLKIFWLCCCWWHLLTLDFLAWRQRMATPKIFGATCQLSTMGGFNEVWSILSNWNKSHFMI